MNVNDSTNSKSVVELIRDLKDELSLLARQEVALAKTEVSEKISKASRQVVYLVLGGFVAYASLLFLLAALTAGLALVFGAAGGESYAFWLAPLIVGLLVAAVAAFLVAKGVKGLKSESLKPTRTLRSIQENKKWITNQVST